MCVCLNDVCVHYNMNFDNELCWYNKDNTCQFSSYVKLENNIVLFTILCTMIIIMLVQQGHYVPIIKLR